MQWSSKEQMTMLVRFELIEKRWFNELTIYNGLQLNKGSVIFINFIGCVNFDFKSVLIALLNLTF